MKKTLKTVSLSLLMTLLAIPAMAQNFRPQQRAPWGDRPSQREPGPRMERMERMRNMVSAETRAQIHADAFNKFIDLSDDQVEKLIKIDLDLATKMDELRDASLAPDRRKVAMKDLQIEKQLAIHELLNKDQYATYIKERESIRIEIQKGIRDAGGDLPAPGPDQE